MNTMEGDIYMNTILNCKGFEKNLFDRKSNPGYIGVQYIFKFENNYGASVIKHMGSYGHSLDLWELAVLEFNEDKWSLCYDTEITDDVLGYLSDKEVRETLQKIKDL